MKKEPYITLRQLKSGVCYQVRIRTEDAEVTKSFKSKDYPTPRIALDSAVQFRDRWLYEYRSGLMVKESKLTVQDMFDKYLDTTTNSYKTKRKHSYLFGKYVLHKDTKIQALTKADIQADLNKMVEDASDDTIMKVYGIWKDAVVGTALMNDIIARDIMLGVKRPESKKIHIKKDTTTDKDTVEKVKFYIRKCVSDHYNARIICFLLDTLYYTGMRPAEALALTREDIKNGISVTKEIGSSMDDTGVVRRCKTPNSIRVIPIHPELKPILEELKEYSQFDSLFMNSNGKYMETDWIGNIITRVCKMNGIKFNMYRLRHNMATQLVTNNVDSKTTVELLGHANYDMSIYYANSNDDLKEEAIKYLA